MRSWSPVAEDNPSLRSGMPCYRCRMDRNSGLGAVSERRSRLLSERFRTPLIIAVLSYTFLVSAPVVTQPIGAPGIDSGWIWAFNIAAQEDIQWGRDIVFTYGPLAFLLVPLDVGANLILGNVFTLGVHALFGFSVIRIACFHRSVTSAVAFAVMFLVAYQQRPPMESMILATLVMLCSVALVLNKPWIAGVAGTISGIGFFIKLTLAAVGIAVLLVTVAAAYARTRRTRFLGAVGVPTCAAIAIGGFVCFESAFVAFRWVRLALDQISGYSVTASVPEHTLPLAVGVTLLLAWLAFGFWSRKNSLLLVFHLAALPLAVMGFRHAFVRQYTHHVYFVPLLLVLISCSMMMSPKRRQVLIHAVAFCIVLLVGAFAGLAHPIQRGLLPDHILSGGPGLRGLMSLTHLAETRRELARQSTENLKPLRLPDTWLPALREAEHGVGTLPWEILYCPANDLKWNPTPTTQLYQANTSFVDRWSSSHYRGDSAPEFIINEFVPVGRRQQFADAPVTWRTVLLNYRPVAVLERRNALLLHRRPESLREEWIDLGSETLDLDSHHRVPDFDGPLFAHIRIKPTLLGRLQKTVFRIPPVMLHLSHVSGHVSFCRLIPATAVDGVLINQYPRDFVGYQRLMSGVTDDPVIRLSIGGPGVRLFHPEASVTWKGLRLDRSTENATNTEFSAPPETLR